MTKMTKRQKERMATAPAEGQKHAFTTLSLEQPLWGENDDTSIVKVSIGFKTSGLPAIGLPTRRQTRGKEF